MLLGEGAYLLHQRGQERIVDILPVDADALLKALNVGGGKEPGFIPRRAEDGLQHRSCGALAVGAGDVDETERLLRGTERREEGAGIPEGAAAARGVERMDVGNSFFRLHSYHQKSGIRRWTPLITHSKLWGGPGYTRPSSRGK